MSQPCRLPSSTRPLFSPGCATLHVIRRCRPNLPAATRRDLLSSSMLLGIGTTTGSASAEASELSTASSAVPRTELAPGFTISQVVKGCWQLGGGHGGDRESNRTSGRAALEDFQVFVDAGITTFDTADIYGPSEQLIGKYLAAHWDHRDRVQVLTKFCCFGDVMQRAADFREVEKAIDGSRLRLGLPSLDLIQFFWQDYRNKNYVIVAEHLAELQARGMVKHVGLTNFDVPRLQEMLDAGVKIVSNQVQYSLLDRRPEVAMTDFCREHGIKLLPYGTVAGGFLSEKYLGVDSADVVLDTYSKSKYAAVLGQSGGWRWLQQLLRTLSGVAAKHGVSVADVASKWVLDRPTVAAVVLGARNASHVADHVRMCSLELDERDLAAIQTVLDEGVQPASDCYSWERGSEW